MSFSRPNQAERDPVATELLAQCARQLFDIGRIDLAHSVARLALETDVSFGNAHSVMAGVLDALGDFDGALRHWREAARLMPDAPKQRLNLALALLGDGDWEAGLPLYEARLENGDWSSMAARGSLAAVRDRVPWPDTALHGRRVLVVSEQGLGDAIWSARFLAPLAARCMEVTVATKAVLRPVLTRVEGPVDGGLNPCKSGDQAI
jgi:tetratricopeptide (TPR) repeat protein